MNPESLRQGVLGSIESRQASREVSAAYAELETAQDKLYDLGASFTEDFHHADGFIFSRSIYAWPSDAEGWPGADIPRREPDKDENQLELCEIRFSYPVDIETEAAIIRATGIHEPSLEHPIGEGNIIADVDLGYTNLWYGARENQRSAMKIAGLDIITRLKADGSSTLLTEEGHRQMTEAGLSADELDFVANAEDLIVGDAYLERLNWRFPVLDIAIGGGFFATTHIHKPLDIIQQSRDISYTISQLQKVHHAIQKS